MGVTTAAYLESLLKPGKNDAPNPRAALIEDIRDASSEDAVLLEITLRPGAFEQVEAAYGDAETDPLEDAFKLRGPLRAHLNYYSAEGAVLEFGECYLAAILYWAPLRRDLYAARVGRARIVARLRVREEEETLRYIAAAAELDLGAAADDEAAAAALRARAFPPLDRALLHEPGYTPNADLERLVTGGPGASFDYLLDLKLRDMVQSAVAKRRQTLVRLREDLARASAQLDERPVACASVWRAELETFKSVVARGVATGWTFK
jgi:hypothetical protein